MNVRVLGPLEVLIDGVDVRLGGPKQRTVLALLAAEVGRPVSVNTLIDGVWGDEPTTAARSTLQTYVSNLRAAIGDVIVRHDGGYRLVQRLLENEQRTLDKIPVDQSAERDVDARDPLARAERTPWRPRLGRALRALAWQGRCRGCIGHCLKDADASGRRPLAWASVRGMTPERLTLRRGRACRRIHRVLTRKG